MLDVGHEDGKRPSGFLDEHTHRIQQVRRLHVAHRDGLANAGDPNAGIVKTGFHICLLCVLAGQAVTV